MSASSATSCVFCIQLSASGGANGITFADLMVERLMDNGTVPSAFVPGVS
jgi:hypothetical protein